MNKEELTKLALERFEKLYKIEDWDDNIMYIRVEKTSLKNFFDKIVDEIFKNKHQ